MESLNGVLDRYRSRCQRAATWQSLKVSALRAGMLKTITWLHWLKFDNHRNVYGVGKLTLSNLLAMASKWRLRFPRIYFFCTPNLVRAPAIIFFPYQPNILFCGIMGLLSVKSAANESSPVLISRLLTAIDQITLADAPSTVNAKAVGQVLDEIFTLRAENHIADILANTSLQAGLQKAAARLEETLAQAQSYRAQQAGSLASADWERLNSMTVLLKDALWALNKDILANLDLIRSLAGAGASPLSIKRFAQINLVLKSIDRLEVRGRDSAGIEISFTFANENWERALVEIDKRSLAEELQERARPTDTMNRSIHIFAQEAAGGQTGISFIYKTFAIVGELGRNVRNLRQSIANDELLHIFAAWDAQNEAILSHTRWASVGAISEENCHPINNHTLYGAARPPISVVLNGDIDNHVALRAQLEDDKPLIASGISTDTKVIPLLIDSFISAGKSIEEAFRLALCSFTGSHAIAMRHAAAPSKLFLAQRGSGQTLYVGLTQQGYIFSSELYGLIEATARFLRLDGETLSSAGGNGQIFVLDQEGEGDWRGIRAFFYDGEPLTLSETIVRRAEITSRDIDRGEHPHYFLKEIMESPRSVANTLLGKYHFKEDGDSRRLQFRLGEVVLPARVVRGLQQGDFTDIFVIGHGTAGIAAAAVAGTLTRYFQNSRLRISDKIASELSGFHIERDFSRTIVIPITQSGTTTDTNRAVAMAKERGAVVLSIVNRRQSDITAKSDGVFYTSDGRDIEMSVASTKAFYSQIVAGSVLGLALALAAGEITADEASSEVKVLEGIAPAMRELLAQRGLIQEAARLAVSGARHWAIVGSGPNKIAADEIRIKLSELCYKTISTDIIENKKHIDLSAEPLIIVCAAGTPPSVLEDVLKDVAIFKAHRSQVVVFADEGETRFADIADAVVPIANAQYPVSIVLNTIAGHLWGYYAALFINEEAQFFKSFRARLSFLMEEHGAAGKSIYEQISDEHTKILVAEFTRETQKRIAAGAFLAAESKTLNDLTILLRYACGKLPLNDFWEEFGSSGNISPLLALDATLKGMVDALSRPVDAIRHQAKTVTVGTSRKELAPTGMVFALASELGFSHKDIIGGNALAIMRVQHIISSIVGYTLYLVEGLGKNSRPQAGTKIKVERRGGISLQMPSRTEGSLELMGTKRTIMRKKDIYIGCGKADGAPILIFPLRNVADSSKEFLLLIHVRFDDSLPWEVKKRALGTRYGDIRNLVDEYNIVWSEAYLQDFPLARLLGEQAEVITLEIREKLAAM